jgi:hypothetical protein
LDALSEGDETVTLGLATGASYNLTILSNATVVIKDRPLDDWRWKNFTTGELANPSVSGDLADPDGDGLANLMECDLGLQPKLPSVNVFSPRIDAHHFTLTYTQSKSATDVLLTLETSADLLTWTPNPAQFEPVDCVDEGTLRRITVRLVALANSAATYTRFRVQRL